MSGSAIPPPVCRLRLHNFRLAIAADVFVEHVGHASFASLPTEESAARIAASDAALYRKLIAAYGRSRIPPAQTLWGNSLFAEAMKRQGSAVATG